MVGARFVAISAPCSYRIPPVTLSSPTHPAATIPALPRCYHSSPTPPAFTCCLFVGCRFHRRTSGFSRLLDYPVEASRASLPEAMLVVPLANRVLECAAFVDRCYCHRHSRTRRNFLALIRTRCTAGCIFSIMMMRCTAGRFMMMVMICTGGRFGRLHTAANREALCFARALFRIFLDMLLLPGLCVHTFLGRCAFDAFA